MKVYTNIFAQAHSSGMCSRKCSTFTGSKWSQWKGFSGLRWLRALTCDLQADLSNIVTAVGVHSTSVISLVFGWSFADKQGHIHVLVVPRWYSKRKARWWWCWFSIFKSQYVSSVPHFCPNYCLDFCIYYFFWRADNTVEQCLMTIQSNGLCLAINFHKSYKRKHHVSISHSKMTPLQPISPWRCTCISATKVVFCSVNQDRLAVFFQSTFKL